MCPRLRIKIHESLAKEATVQGNSAYPYDALKPNYGEKPVYSPPVLKSTVFIKS
jgi:hypothetical protein